MFLPQFHPQIKETILNHTLAMSFSHFFNSFIQQIFIGYLFSAVCLLGAGDIILKDFTVQLGEHSVKPPYKTVGLMKRKKYSFVTYEVVIYVYHRCIRMKHTKKIVTFNLK